MPSVRTGLTTRGRSLIAAGIACVVCAVVLDERDLLRIGTLLVVLPVLTAVLYRLAPLRLDITRSVAPQPVSVADDVYVELRLHARSRTAVGGLLLCDAVPDSCGTAGAYVLGGLRAGATSTVRYPLTPRLRGRHQLGPLQLSVADPLGLVELIRTVGGPTPVLIRPRVDQLASTPSAAASGGMSAAQRSGGQTLPDAQLRTYVAGDDMRSIHWRSTARRGELMVRTAEQDRSAGTVVVLDVRSEGHAGVGERSSLERAVSLTATLAVHLQRRGLPVQVLTTDGVQLSAGEKALDELALLQPSGHHDIGAVLRLVGTRRVVAVFGRLDAAAAAMLLHESGRAGSAGAVHLLPSDGAARLHAAGWVTVEANISTTAATIWDALNRPKTL